MQPRELPRTRLKARVSCERLDGLLDWSEINRQSPTEEAGGGRDSDRAIPRFDRSKIDGRDHGSYGKVPASQD